MSTLASTPFFESRLVRFHHAVESSITLAAITMNLCLLYLIRKHSHFKVQAYKNILLLSCLTDMWLATIVFISQPLLLSSNGYMILITNGFFAGRNGVVDHVTLAFYCGSLHSSIVCVVVQYFHRYQVVCRADDPKTPRLMWQFSLFAILYCLAQVTDATFTFAAGHTEEQRWQALAMLEKSYGWSFDNATAPYPSSTHYAEVKTLVHHCFYLVSSACGYTLVIYCQSQIIVYLRRFGSSFRQSTRNLHEEVNRAMVALAITPLFAQMGPAFLYITQTILELGAPYTVYMSLCVSAIVLINPMTTIFFVRPYRRAFVAWFSFAKRNDGGGNEVVPYTVSSSQEKPPATAATTQP